MTQHFRVGKTTVCFIVRNYSNQRFESRHLVIIGSQQSHYETLKVSSDASQKDIKQAFFKLSKQMHPDTSGKCSHTDFVKLNEAYSVLGKASTRRKYDEYLKYKYNPYMYSHTYGCSQARNRQYKSQWEYEVRTAGGPWPPPKQKPNTYFGLTIALLFLMMGIFHLIFMLHSMKVRKLNQLRSMQIQRHYQNIKSSK